MKHALPFLLSGLVILSACKKEEEAPCPPTEYKSYHPMTKGSYWVYETYRVDTLGNETPLNLYDSIIVSGDTTIDGKVYAVVEGTYGPFHRNWEIVRIIREENGNIINESGDILFSSTNFSDTLKEGLQLYPTGDTIFHSVFKMHDPQQSTTVPAGTFNVLDTRGIYHIPLPPSGVPNERIVHNEYAEEVGKVFENYFFMSSPDDYQIRLLRYHIEE